MIRSIQYYAVISLAALLLPGLAKPLAAAEAKPLPKDQKGPGTKEFEKAFFQRDLKLVDDYHRLTHDPANLRARVETFLKHFMAQERSMPKSLPHSAQTKEGDELYGAGCRDPLFLMAYGRNLESTGRLVDAVARLQEAWDGFGNSKYPPECRVQAALRGYSAAVTQSHAGNNILGEWNARIIESTPVWLTQAKYGRDEVRFAWLLIVDSLKFQVQHDVSDYEARCNMFAKFKDAPNLDPWLREMIAGMHHHQVAWHFRGDGFANTVTEEGGRKFAENIKIAATHFKAAYKLRPDLPEAPAIMISESAVGGDQTASPREWFDRTVAIQFDYLPAYDHMRWFLRPRWGGSHKQMYQFGRECAATLRYDTDVPFQLIEAIYDIRGERDDLEGKTWQVVGVYKNGREVFRSMAALPERADDKWGRLNQSHVRAQWFAAAMGAGEYEDARKLLETVNEKNIQPFYNSSGRNFQVDRAKVYAITGKAGDLVRQIEAMRDEPASPHADNPQPDQRRTELIQQARKLDTDARSAPYYALLVGRDVNQRSYDKGQWVKLTFDKELSNWRALRGNWTVENENSILGDDLKSQDSLCLEPRLNFNGPFVIELDIEQIEQQHETYQTGLVFGDPASSTDGNPNMAKVFVNNHHGRVGFALAGERTRGVDIPPKENKYRVAAIISDGRLELMVDGKYLAPFSEPRFKPGPMVALGSEMRTPAFGKTRFSNVRVHQWTRRPVRKDISMSDPQVRDYFSKAVEIFPECAHFQRLSGMAAYYTGDNKTSAQALQKAIDLDPSVMTMGCLGRAHHHLGDEVKAREAFERELLDPGSGFEARIWMSTLLSTAKDPAVRDPNRAIQLANEASMAHGHQDPGPMSVLAIAHAAAGNFAEAVKLQEKAVELTPDAPTRQRREATLKRFKENKPYEFEKNVQ